MVSNVVWFLELLIKTHGDGFVSEPIGAFSTEKEAYKYLKKANDKFGPDTECSLIPIFLDESPPILEYANQTKEEVTGEVLYSLYKNGVLEQMVEEDGTFSYYLGADFQSSLEKTISRRI